jgi:DNA-binding XRE family transcriptional regulator
MDWGVQHIVTPDGDVLVVMPLAQFQRMSAAAGPSMPSGAGIAPQPPAMPSLGSMPTPMPSEVEHAIAEGESPLAAWRKYRDISQSKLARAAGVSRFTVMRMEAGGVGAGNRQSRQLLASALGIPVGAL